MDVVQTYYHHRFQGICHYKYNNFTEHYEETRLIINKSISFSAQSTNVSRYIQCQYDLKTGDPYIISWNFDDLS